MARALRVVTVAIALIAVTAIAASAAEVKPGDFITRKNAEDVRGLVSPGTYVLVQQGMEMNIVPAKGYEWPPPYKQSTEQYSSQVSLDAQGDLKNYLAGLPFPNLDPNDPQIARKVMWNFQFGPEFTDDLDSQDDALATYASWKKEPYGLYPIGHIAVYRNVGRTEVSPVPTDHDGGTGIMERFAVGPIIVPIEPPFFQTPWIWFVRYRYMDPTLSDKMWAPFGYWNWPRSQMISPTYYGSNAFFGNLDLDSLFGFADKLNYWDFKFLGIKNMLAVVHARWMPAKQCAADGGRTICPENWEMRKVYVIEADARKPSYIGDRPPISKRILYIDSQGWFITASDQYDRAGGLWKAIVIFNTVRDRQYPDSKSAVYSFPRILQTALVDEDVTDGYSTILFTPNPERGHHDTWFVNQGIISQRWIIPQRFTEFREYFY
jgi:Protein of unknown function (DUF1329)